MKTLEELRNLANIKNNPDIFEWFCETCRSSAPANKPKPSKCCHTPKNVKIFLGDTPYDNDAWSAAGAACEIIEDLTPLIDEVERLREQVEDLKQAASGNDERHGLLVAKHNGLPFDAARLAVLHEEVSRAFPRVEASMEAQMEIIELRSEVERLRSAIETSKEKMLAELQSLADSGILSHEEADDCFQNAVKKLGW